MIFDRMILHPSLDSIAFSASFSFAVEIFFEDRSRFCDSLYAFRVTSSPTCRSRSFLLHENANSRFSFDSINMLSISELTPCAPRLYSMSHTATNRMPSFLMFIAAFTSLL